MITTGTFYSSLKERNSYSAETASCIERMVEKLIDVNTSLNKPAMLLGKIQSGKTKTFIGIIGLALDNEYDLVIILTKGTKALTSQTIQRLEQEFQIFEDQDNLQIFDIMNIPTNLTPYELSQKIIIVSKKETKNLKRLKKALFETHPSLSQKRVLIIDDEADFASVGFKKTKEEKEIDMNKIAAQIDEVRKDLTYIDFLQVTATPYSLYLQPDDSESNQLYEPQRPSFTELVPVHEDYIGGDYYFEESSDADSVASCLYEPVLPDELRVLRDEDRRVFKIQESLTSSKIRSIRDAIINFVVGGCIRRLQNRHMNIPEKKYSFIIHTEVSRSSHQWQERIIRDIVAQLEKSMTDDKSLFMDLIIKSYENLSKSINLMGHYLPDSDQVILEVENALQRGYLMITVVNAGNSIQQLLDDKGQLKLRTPLNIFIGGQILDRGITISNLIGFYYGRRPNVFQQDTVLQHSRMYGFRPIEDLTVTRFYTTQGIYDAMQNIHRFDSSLRQAFEKGSHQNGIIFIRRDNHNRIVPCSPNKILLSTTTTLTPYRRLLPLGFQTVSKGKMRLLMKEIDELIDENNRNTREPFLIDVSLAKIIIDKINATYEFEEPFCWDVKAFKSSMEYLSNSVEDPERKGRIWCLLRKDRELSRYKSDRSLSNQPDNPETDQTVARETAIDTPMLILTQQVGSEELEWSGSPFWWPVLWIPRDVQTVIFASDINDS